MNDGIDRATSLLRSPPRKSKTRIRSQSDAAGSASAPKPVRGGQEYGMGGSMEMDQNPSASPPRSKPPLKSHKRESSLVSSDEPDENRQAASIKDGIREDEDGLMSDLALKMSNVRMVPPSVKFGRRGPVAGFAKK